MSYLILLSKIDLFMSNMSTPALNFQRFKLILYFIAALASNVQEEDPKVPVASTAESQDSVSNDKDSQLSNDQFSEDYDSSQEEDLDVLSDPDEGELSDEGSSVVQDQGVFMSLFSYSEGLQYTQV